MTAATDPRQALRQIIDLAKPGQEIDLTQAVDILCDIWNIAKAATREEPAQ